MIFETHLVRRSAAKAGRSFAVTLLASSSLFCASSAFAQSGTATSQSAAPKIEEVVVSAQKRHQDVQKVPVAVNVISGSLANSENRHDISALTAIVPTVEFRAQPSNKDMDILIRGLGTITTSPGVEPTVSTVVDGVVLARPGQMVSDFFDVNRIEVLNGPQGTLFGKNASAGVINIVTNNPSRQTGGYLDASYYQGHEYRLAGAFTGPINDVLAGRIAVVTASYAGNGRNLYGGAKINGYHTDGLRAKLLYTPTNNLSVLLSYDIMSSDNTNALPYVATYNISYPFGVKTYSANLQQVLTTEGITPSFSNTNVSINTPGRDVDLSTGASAQVDYRFHGYHLTSITGYRFWRNVQTQDIDGYSALTPQTPYQLADLGHVRLNQYSEELRVASPLGGFIDYVAGLYFFHAPDYETYQRTTTHLSNGVLTVNSGLNTYGATSTDYAVFGQANLNFTSYFRGIVGLRLIHDDLSFYTNRVSTSPTPVPGINPSFVANGSTHHDDYSTKLGLQYDLSSSIHTYVTYSRGYKGPAYNVFFNMNPLDTLPLAPETSNDYELGFKSTLFNDSVLFNVGAWLDNVSGYQANEPDLVAGTVVTRLIYAGQVRTSGVQLDAMYLASDDLTFSGTFAYTDAKIVKFNCPPQAAVSCDVNGKPLPFAPKTKFDIQADYLAYSTDTYDVGLRTDYSYQSSQQDSISQTPDTIQPGYGIWNGSVSLKNKPSGWNVRFVVNNILDQHYYTALIETNGGLIGQVPRDFRRYVGIQFHKSFD